MNRSDFEDRIKFFQIGDWIKLTCRGNYGYYRETGRLVKIENGRVYLDRGMSHSYRRIQRIDVCLDEEKEESS